MQKHELLIDERHRVPEDALPDVVEIEADTVEEAMTRVAAEVGERAQIVEAKKVLKGGIAGFFAKERVQLTARPRGVPESHSDHPSSEQSQDFKAVLRRQFTDSPDGAMPAFITPTADTEPPLGASEESPPLVAVGPAVQTTNAAISGSVTVVDPAGNSLVVTPAPEQSLPQPGPKLPLGQVGSPVAGLGPAAWGSSELVRHGVPGRLVAAVALLEPYDDLGWIAQLASAVADTCVGLPESDTVIVGPDAGRFADALGFPFVEPGAMAPYEGSFCTSIDGTQADQEWLEFVLGGRDLHLIVDEHGRWRDALVADPSVVSWSSHRVVVAALYLADTLGATLGMGPTTDGFAVAQPVDVALALRQLVGRR